ncbi:MAG: hypothetical protein ACI8TP_002093 [Acidimicrobiales bacterium]|jgi:hypothetical protein
MRALNPNAVTERADATNAWARIYVRSYLTLRLAIGAIGIALPFVMVLVVDLLEGNNPATRGSFSAYYWSGARDVFVAALCVIGVFLIGYKFRSKRASSTNFFESRMASVAGVAAIVVAFFPTNRPAVEAGARSIPSTPLQDLLGETAVRNIHYTAAVIFILMLAYISFHFAAAEGPRTARPPEQIRLQKWSPGQWQTFHRICGGAIIAAVAGFGLVKLLNLPDKHALFITELVATVSFGLSWTTKGWEWRILKLANPR